MRIMALQLSIFFLSAIFIATAMSSAANKSSQPIIVRSGHEKWVRNDRWLKGDMLAFSKGQPRLVGQWLIREKIPPHSVPPEL